MNDDIHPDDFYNKCALLLPLFHPGKTTSEESFDYFTVSCSEVAARFCYYNGGGDWDNESLEIPFWAFEIPIEDVQQRLEEERKKKEEEKRLAQLRKEEENRIAVERTKKLVEEQEYQFYLKLKEKYDTQRTD